MNIDRIESVNDISQLEAITLEELDRTFDSLVTTLEQACCSVNTDVERFHSVVCTAREIAENQRTEIAESQSHIHRYVATRVETLDRAEIESWPELPDSHSAVAGDLGASRH